MELEQLFPMGIGDLHQNSRVRTSMEESEDNPACRSISSTATDDSTDSTSRTSPNLDLKSSPTNGISKPEKTPLIERAVNANAFLLRTKVFKRPRRTEFYWVEGYNMLHGVSQGLVVLSLIIVPILLVELRVYPAVQFMGNLPYYDCT
jgi:hypothetical protein